MMIEREMITNIKNVKDKGKERYKIIDKAKKTNTPAKSTSNKNLELMNVSKTNKEIIIETNKSINNVKMIDSDTTNDSQKDNGSFRDKMT